MLLDPKWEVDLKIKLEPWRQLLLDGADRIEHEGWYCGSGGTGYCIITSLAEFSDMTIKREALDRFAAYIGPESALIPDRTRGTIVSWNDTIARTKKQVLFAMRDCARNG